MRILVHMIRHHLPYKCDGHFHGANCRVSWESNPKVAFPEKAILRNLGDLMAKGEHNYFRDILPALRVVPAISTTPVTTNSIDWFAAVDSLLVNASEDSQQGTEQDTGHSVCYEHPVFYEPCLLDWATLVTCLRNDVDLATAALEAFLRATVQEEHIRRELTGDTVSRAVMVELSLLRNPSLYSTAFQKRRYYPACDVGGQGIASLSEYSRRTNRTYDRKIPESLYLTRHGEEIADSTRVATVDDLIMGTINAVLREAARANR